VKENILVIPDQVVDNGPSPGCAKINYTPQGCCSACKQKFDPCTSASRLLYFSFLFLLLSGINAHAAEPGSVFAYGGKWSDNQWNEIIRGRTALRSSYVWAAGATKKLHAFSESLGLEGEFNIARNSGQQNHFELNTATVLRWDAFPWSRYVATSVGYGLGLSYAFARPPIEEQPQRRASRTLIFMPTELTFGPPQSAWEFMLRIHHRSGAFGVFKDAGGSNFISLGLRFKPTKFRTTSPKTTADI
jgi:hypothetical protein